MSSTWGRADQHTSRDSNESGAFCFARKNGGLVDWADSSRRQSMRWERQLSIRDLWFPPLSDVPSPEALSYSRAPLPARPRQGSTGPGSTVSSGIRSLGREIPKQRLRSEFVTFSKLPKIDAANKTVTTTKSSKIRKNHKLSGPAFWQKTRERTLGCQLSAVTNLRATPRSRSAAELNYSAAVAFGWSAGW